MQEILWFGIGRCSLLPWSFYDIIINATESLVQVGSTLQEARDSQKEKEKKISVPPPANPKHVYESATQSVD